MRDRKRERKEDRKRDREKKREWAEIENKMSHHERSISQKLPLKLPNFSSNILIFFHICILFSVCINIYIKNILNHLHILYNVPFLYGKRRSCMFKFYWLNFVEVWWLSKSVKCTHNILMIGKQF